MKSYLMILFVSASTIACQLLLKKGVNITVEKKLHDGSVNFLLNALLSPYVITALILQVAAYLVWLIVISRLKIGFAFAISGAFAYILLAFAGWFFLDERLAAVQWLGIFLITAGLICMSIRNG